MLNKLFFKGSEASHGAVRELADSFNRYFTEVVLKFAKELPPPLSRSLRVRWRNVWRLSFQVR